MNVWIDLANSPHVPFFLPIIRALEADKHCVTITLRDFAQTVSLAHRANLGGAVIGTHGGRGRAGKVANLVARSNALFTFAHNRGFDLAVSHNSYAHIIAGRFRGARVVTLMDYEGQPANHLAFRLAHRVLVPDCFPDRDLARFGATPAKTLKYTGYKEQVYLSDFAPDPSFPGQLAAACRLSEAWTPDRTIIVTVRSPPTMAAYHRFANPIFEALMKRITRMDELTVIALPRTPDQRLDLQSRYPSLRIPSQALDGNNLVAFSDVVISAGGTMNREAAVLGTPAITVFAGAVPAVDLQLIDLDRLKVLRGMSEVATLRFAKKKPGIALTAPDLKRYIAREVVACA